MQLRDGEEISIILYKWLSFELRNISEHIYQCSDVVVYITGVLC